MFCYYLIAVDMFFKYLSNTERPMQVKGAGEAAASWPARDTCVRKGGGRDGDAGGKKRAFEASALL